MKDEKSDADTEGVATAGSSDLPVADTVGAAHRERTFSYRTKNFVDLTALIRSIQRAEGNTDCFRRGAFDIWCDQMECTWRAHCFNRNVSDG